MTLANHNRLLRVLSLILLSTAFLSAKSNSQELGRVYQSDQQPNSQCVDYQGHSIGKSPELNLDIANCDGRSEAWLSRWSDSGVDRGWKIIDHLRLGTFETDSDYQVTFSPLCILSKPDQRVHWVVVLNKKIRGKYTFKNGGIVQVWAINPNTLRFELAPKKLVDRVVCMDEEG